MKFVVIFGPSAVGKMTVAFALSKLTGLRTFHNHMTIELALNYFDYHQPQFRRLVEEFRQRIFEEVAASDLPGLIFTYVWALDEPMDRQAIDRYCAPFKAGNGEICFVELQADLEQRLARNGTASRLEHKPSKRDSVKSREVLLEHEKRYRMNSDGDFCYPESHLKIDNTELAADAVALRIAERFDLPRLSSAL
jgi:hypothetical protein